MLHSTVHTANKIQFGFHIQIPSSAKITSPKRKIVNESKLYHIVLGLGLEKYKRSLGHLVALESEKVLKNNGKMSKHTGANWKGLSKVGVI